MMAISKFTRILLIYTGIVGIIMLFINLFLPFLKMVNS